MKLYVLAFFQYAICRELSQISLTLVRVNGSFEVFSAGFESCFRLLKGCALSIVMLMIRTF